jgi:hypothetical protein
MMKYKRSQSQRGRKSGLKNRFMKTVIVSLCLVFFALLSCNQRTQKYYYVCNCEESENVEKFITENIKNANNYSDEEMEDVIHELRLDGIRLNCHQRLIWVEGDGHTIDWSLNNKLDTGEVITGIEY